MDERLKRQKTLMELGSERQGQAELVSPMLEGWDAVVKRLDTITRKQIEAAEHKESPC